MLEVIALAVAIQVSVNWMTAKLSPSAPQEIQEINVEVDANDLVCSKDTTYIVESKVLKGRYKLDGISSFDLTSELTKPDLSDSIPNTDNITRTIQPIEVEDKDDIVVQLPSVRGLPSLSDNLGSLKD
jgi:hypothetical protein